MHIPILKEVVIFEKPNLQKDLEEREVQRVEANLREDIKEEVKNEEFRKEEESKYKLRELIKNSQKPLFALSTIFPFDLFPDKLVIEIDHINIYFHDFFSTGQARSIPIQNITEVIIEASPFFTTLKIIEGMIGAGEELKLKPVKRNEAIKAKRIIFGLLIASKENVDLTNLGPSEIARQVEELGKAQEPEFFSN